MVSWEDSGVIPPQRDCLGDEPGIRTTVRVPNRVSILYNGKYFRGRVPSVAWMMGLEGNHPSFRIFTDIVTLRRFQAFRSRATRLSYAEVLVAQLEPTIFVKHSMGGVIISRVSETRPENHDVLHIIRNPEV